VTVAPDSTTRAVANTLAVATTPPVATTLAVPTTRTRSTAPRLNDQAFLDEQLSRVVAAPRGAFMVAIVDSSGRTVHASEGPDSDKRLPTPEDTFRVGDITKIFTSLLTLLLVDEGVVDLDAPAANYVTRVRVPPGVTVRDLLQHTSGIPNFVETPGFWDRVLNRPRRVWSPEDVAGLVEDQAPLFEPGAEFGFADTNYVVLGILIEEVTGQDFAQEMRTRIIRPLGLDSTYLAGSEKGPEPFGAYTSMRGDHEPIDFDYTSAATAEWAAGAMVSSAIDLHALLSAVFERRVISEESLAEMTANDEYGLGIGYAGENLYGHDGWMPGYGTVVLHGPRSGMTAF
jgi:D-alanyl-D-alanine carboxypeptidase